jgi:hypothetical protein
MSIPTDSDFQSELNKIYYEAKSKRLSSIRVKAGEIHHRVGDYPNPSDHRMPVCCSVMRKNM